jgi:hypothetical protein
MDFRLLDDRCPKCDHVLDAATPAVGPSRKPRPGDLSVCLNCANLLTFKADLLVRTLTLDELERIDPRTALLLLEARARVFLLQELRRKGLI